MQGLVGFWPLGDNLLKPRELTGNSAWDGSGLIDPGAGTAKIVGSEVGEVYFNPGFSEATGNYYQFATANTLFTGSQNRTVLMWVQFESASHSSGLFTIDPGNNGANGERWSLRTVPDKLRVEIQGQGADFGTTVAGEWMFVALKLDGTTLGDHTGYINGDSFAITGANTVNTNSTYEVRGARVSSNRFHGGEMAHLCVFDRALSDDEIFRFYHPATRWDLYHELERKSYFVPAVVTGVLNLVMAPYKPA